jgi:predicted metal-dependent peptidase
VSSESAHAFTALETAAARQSAEEAAAKALAGARARLILGRDAKSVFFATLVLRLNPEPAWDVDTIATDGRVLRYNPWFVTDLKTEELVGVLAHEVMHCALAHMVRRGTRDLTLWNIACDLAINPLLLDAGMALPDSRLVPGEGQFSDLPSGKSAEEYFSALMKGQDDRDGDEAPGGEMASHDPGGCGQVLDVPNVDSAAVRASESDWKIALVQAQQVAQGRGDLPAGLGRTVEGIVNPPTDWRSVLREFVSSHARNDYSWVRPNRRFIAQGLYLPGLHSEELGEVVLAVDTSGSIDEKLLGVFAQEVNAVLAAYDCSVTVLYHDTVVQKVQSWTSADGPLVLDPVGGGGTSHVCVFDWIDQEVVNPACVICLTDLETAFPDSVPGLPVLWAVAGPCRGKAPFGQVVALSC